MKSLRLYMNSWCRSYCYDITSGHLIRTQQHLGFIHCGSAGLYFGERESWALPSSPLCVAVVTHSSPGPKLPQSNTASLRTLVYASAAEQGSGGDSRWEIQLYTHVQTHNRHVTSVSHLSGVHPVSNLIRARSVTGVSTQTGTGNLLFNPLWHRSEAHTAVKMGNVWLSLFKRWFADLKDSNSQSGWASKVLLSESILLHHTAALQRRGFESLSVI